MKLHVKSVCVCGFVYGWVSKYTCGHDVHVRGYVDEAICVNVLCVYAGVCVGVLYVYVCIYVYVSVVWGCKYVCIYVYRCVHI